MTDLFALSQTAHVVEFDQVTKLDNWKTALLLKIKNLCTGGESLA